MPQDIQLTGPWYQLSTLAAFVALPIQLQFSETERSNLWLKIRHKQLPNFGALDIALSGHSKLVPCKSSLDKGLQVWLILAYRND